MISTKRRKRVVNVTAATVMTVMTVIETAIETATTITTARKLVASLSRTATAKVSAPDKMIVRAAGHTVTEMIALTVMEP